MPPRNEGAVRSGKDAFDDLDAPVPPDFPGELVQAILAAREKRGE